MAQIETAIAMAVATTITTRNEAPVAGRWKSPRQIAARRAGTRSVDRPGPIPNRFHQRGVQGCEGAISGAGHGDAAAGSGQVGDNRDQPVDVTEHKI